MVDPNHIRQIYERYPELVQKADVDAILDLYAEGASIEDPIGSELRVGKEAVREFYAALGPVNMKRSGPVRVAGREAATPLIVILGEPGDQKILDIISVMSFDDDGKIETMRAYWSSDAIRPATPRDLED